MALGGERAWDGLDRSMLFRDFGGEVAKAISCAACTKDARVAAGCPEKEYESDRARLRVGWGMFWVGVGSPNPRSGSDSVMLAGLDAGALATLCK
jgi:hypothetical protein